MPTVYLIEDDVTLRSELARLLELQGLFCIECQDFAHAAADVLQERPDCVILDLHLPESDGFVICRDIRKESLVPVLVLTSSDAEFDEVMSMNLGADDFLTKPYRPAVLIARIQALLRRSGMRGPHVVLSHGGVCLDVSSGMLSFQGAETELTRNEQRILSVLLANPGQVITRQELMVELWESDAFIDDNTLTVNVNRVRKALAAVGAPDDFVVTKRGMGYMVQE